MNKDLFDTPLIIRLATHADISAIQHIVQVTWPDAYAKILGEEQVNYMIDKFYSTTSLLRQMEDKHIFFVAFKDNRIIGFASFSSVDQHISKLQKLYVLPGEQKTGAGKALLQTVEKNAKSLGAVKLQLNVNRQNAALSFYKRNGFTVIEEADIDIGKNYFMNDYVMEKDL